MPCTDIAAEPAASLHPSRTTAGLPHPGQRTPSGQRCWRTKAKHLASSIRPERLTKSGAAMNDRAPRRKTRGRSSRRFHHIRSSSEPPVTPLQANTPEPDMSHIYKASRKVGRGATIDTAESRRPAIIVRRLGIRWAGVYRVLGKRVLPTWHLGSGSVITSWFTLRILGWSLDGAPKPAQDSP